MKIPKKIAKKLKKLKNTIPSFSFNPNWDEIGRERGKKKFCPEFRSYMTRAKKFKEKIAKKFKKLKNIIPSLFQSKPGWDKPRNREKKF